MDINFDSHEIISEFKQFAEESHNFFNNEINRIKDDRNFAGGGSAMWNENDESNRGSDRSQVSYNFIANYVDAISNPFKISPYTITVTNKVDGQNASRQIQKRIKDIESKTNAKNSYYNSIKDAITAGYGYGYVTTDIDELSDDTKANILILPIQDCTMVIPDSSSKEIDGSDSEQMAVVEHIKIKKAKSIFGEDVVGDMKYRMPLVANFGETWRTPDGCLALVTYFRRIRTKVGDKNVVSVEFFKMIGDKIVASGELECPFIPIVPMKGEEKFREGKKSYFGIVDKAKPVAKNINYMVSLLRERIAKAPKPLFFASKSAVRGNEEYYENMDKTFNPLIIFNDKDEQGNPVAQPNPINNAVQTQDLSSQIDANLNYMSLIIGMPQTGIVGSVGAQETAESVLMRSRSAESNQSHYYENAKSSIKHIGRILMYFIKQYDDEFNNIKVSDYEVDVNDGPELITTKIESRKDLIALSQILPENMKPLVAQKIAGTMDNDFADVLSKELYQMLPPELKVNIAEDPAAKVIMDQMSAQIDTLTAQVTKDQTTLAQQQAVILELENDSKNMVLIQEMKNRASLQETIIKENSADERLSKKLLADADKKILELQLKAAEDEKVWREKMMSQNKPLFSLTKGIPQV